jgi:hypothetical protein
MVNIYIQDMIADYITFLHKTFSEGLNKHYDRSVKEILSEPIRRFPHTRVSSTCSYHLQQGRTNLEYSIVLHKTYPSGGKKRLQEYARLSDLWVYCICMKHY